MAIKITINNQEIKNPVARFLITMLGLAVFLVLFILIFFVLLPFVWFMVLSIILALLVLMAVLPKLISQYKIIRIEQKFLNQHK